MQSASKKLTNNNERHVCHYFTGESKYDPEKKGNDQSSRVKTKATLKKKIHKAYGHALTRIRCRFHNASHTHKIDDDDDMEQSASLFSILHNVL